MRDDDLSACLNMLLKSLNFYVLALVLFFGSAFAVNPVAATQQSKTTAKSLSKKQTGSGAYCGIYCLYAIMKLIDIDIEPNELLKPEYIGSPKGSSLAELKKAAQDRGLYALPLGNLTTTELRQLPYPVILHVKSSADKKQYNHYELFLETKDGRARLYDPPEPPRLVPFYKLAPRWDGTGLVVSVEEIDHGIIFAPARRRFIIYAALAVVGILVVRWGRRRWLSSTDVLNLRKLLVLSFVQCFGLGFLAVLCGFIYHFVDEEGFLAHQDGTAFIQQAHLASFIPRVGSRQIRKLLHTNVVFVDARFARDFEIDRLEGAVNIPVNTTDDQRHKIMADIAKDSCIVVYCQSANCKFARKVAVKLISDGFSDVSLFESGWRDWAAKAER